MKLPPPLSAISALLCGGALLFLAGCATANTETNPPMRPGGPNWEEVDKTVQRVKEREQNKPRLVETETTQETGFHPMTDEEYAAALDTARAEIKKANPKMSDAEVEKAAVTRADQEKRQAEHTLTRSASSHYELQKP